MTERVANQEVEAIRQSNDIVDIVGEYVQLKKQGRNFFGLCPFHSENTPSFSVNQDKQIFHCFGCGKGGNAITFMMEIEGFTFQQTMAYLAEKAGKPIPQDFQDTSSNHSSEDQAILEAHQWLTKLYHHLLRHSQDGKQALAYLHQRGFTDETIDQFQIGYSPNSRDFVVQFLEKKGFHRQTMVKAGLLTTNDQEHYYDRFRGRAIFPIRNHIGKTVGFVGRAIDGQEPKYLNSSDSSLFQKSKLLYNFDLARSEIRRKNEAILFEGSLDVMAAYQANVKNGIASLGTSLTETHAKMLRRYVDTVLLCYDGDDAGQEATYKALKLLKKTGCTVKVGAMPHEYDPDSYIQSYGENAFVSNVIHHSESDMTFLMRYYKKDFNLQQEGDRIRYVESVIDEIAQLERPIERDHFIRELAEEFSLSLDILKQELNARIQSNQQMTDKRTNFGHTNHGSNWKLPERKAFHNAERQLIAYMLQDEMIAEKVKEEIGSRFNIEAHQIIVTYLYGYYEEGNEPDPSHFLTYIDDADIQQIVVELSMVENDWEITNRELDDYIRIILAEQTDHAKIKQLEKEQKQIEKSDPLKAAQIAMEIIQIKKQLKNLI
ncbi:DNA primase [Gracilibacillus halophilus YIM-C55.5]|uniref:DNA primase n=1 Tax=Gracilibacillus halophilus YIM-C55.5 TaxID=1308866 RepID=N4WMX7_9BACI|nr:DNA primase [Gracilibacillus halophilus]ENH97497.1 DNA primase [Gracilibacillus halophilus YIM-C55.5]